MHDALGQLVTDGSPRIFGEPYQAPDGTIVITVARPSHWRRTTMVPIGVYVIGGGDVVWHPALDATRIALMGEAIGFAAAVIGTLAVLRRPPWPDLSRRPPLEVDQ